MSDHELYTPSLEELRKQAELREEVPENIDIIRERVGQIETDLSEANAQLSLLVETTEKHTEFLQSIDHALYNNVTHEARLLAKILIVLIVLLVVVCISLFL